MKKLILILLAMALVAGAVFAVTGHAHPPGGAYGLEKTTVFWYVANDGVITQHTDLAASTLFGEVALTSTGSMEHDILAMSLQLGDIISMPSMLVASVAAGADYYLRC